MPGVLFLHGRVIGLGSEPFHGKGSIFEISEGFRCLVLPHLGLNYFSDITKIYHFDLFVVDVIISCFELVIRRA